MRLINYTLAIAAVLLFVGCGTSDVSWLEDNNNGKTDQVTNVVDQPASATPTATEVPAAVTPTVVYKDEDGDGYSTKVDCNDDPTKGGAAIHPGAEEKCDGIDNNCNDKTDEDLTQQMFVDKDHDGYGLSDQVTTVCNDAPSLADYAIHGGDCNDSISDLNKDGEFDGYSIHPGADEICGDKVDNSCNDKVDEFPCVSYESGEILLAEPEESLLQLVVAFANPATRTVSLVEYSSADQLGGTWLTSVTSTQSTVKAPINSVNAKCGVRFNVAIGVPADKWLCMGHGTESTLDPEAKFFLELKNKEGWYDVTDQVVPWSDPDSDGCSALLVLTEEGDCNLN